MQAGLTGEAARQARAPASVAQRPVEIGGGGGTGCLAAVGHVSCRHPLPLPRHVHGWSTCTSTGHAASHGGQRRSPERSGAAGSHPVDAPVASVLTGQLQATGPTMRGCMRPWCAHLVGVLQRLQVSKAGACGTAGVSARLQKPEFSRTHLTCTLPRAECMSETVAIARPPCRPR
eukprot:354002-Chlamydomonas_euryale.AAC.1